jgi:hypothetical protein
MTFSSHSDQDKIREIVLAAMDQALQEHLRKLFLNWVSDDIKQPERAQAGARKALKIYREAVDLLEKAEF